jgi:hypothetical protein
LRKTGRNAQRSSRRPSKQRSEGNLTETIPEDQDPSKSGRWQPHRQGTDDDSKQRREDILMADMKDPSLDSVVSTKKSHDPSFTYEKTTGQLLETPGFDDSAPSPAIYQNKRHSSQNADRRKSGRVTPDPADIIRPKRSSSRLNRLSAGTKSAEPILDDGKDATTSEPMVGYERPGSADSVDDAVEAYLCSPRLTQKIRQPQTGRVISFSEVGDPKGSAVFCCVGMGLTRYITAFYDELALALNLRLITPDRPGVGDSEAYDGTTTPLSWPGTLRAYS